MLGPDRTCQVGPLAPASTDACEVRWLVTGGKQREMRGQRGERDKRVATQELTVHDAHAVDPAASKS